MEIRRAQFEGKIIFAECEPRAPIAAHHAEPLAEREVAEAGQHGGERPSGLAGRRHVEEMDATEALAERAMQMDLTPHGAPNG